ncbi:MAG: D-alanyl-D-alanine carboxypeptidase family protein, partial [Pseudomonadota bacterium]
MKARRVTSARFGLFFLAAIWLMIIVPLSAMSAPYAAYVMDARTGKVLHARNADTRLHPASLTKMMTLYVAFQAIERGEISLDTRVTVSKKAAAEPPSKLGLRAGQKIKLRYLIRAAAVKSANDASTAIGEAISGSEARFARRMNRTAKALGMRRTTFKNMHGLTEAGHLSTARDMSIMGRHLLYDYPQYYNLFSRITADAGVRKVSHTNRRFLGSYKGADGIKTGYTRAAGFNLTASAERGNERIIVTVFGGKSTTSRNAKVAELMDLGFRRAPSRAPVRKPKKPLYADVGPIAPKQGNNPGSVLGGMGKTIRLVGAVKTPKRPQLRPGKAPAPVLVAEASGTP